MKLHELKNIKVRKNVQRVGRGPGSKRGKTSCRGQNGDKSRSGYKRRLTKQGGNAPWFQKLPTRGFSNFRFKKEFLTLNLTEIEKYFSDQETVNVETLKTKGMVRPSFNSVRLKILGNGELKKQVKIEASCFTKGAEEKLKKAKVEMTKVK
ncbi:MAG: 50S ribosomal protein L15 [Chlamydiae bacterium]|nr:50S ribosomal protein L15 [Chlamydiota bacterium]